MTIEEFVLSELKRQKKSVTKFVKQLNISRTAFYINLQRLKPDPDFIKKLEAELDIDLSESVNTSGNTLNEDQVEYGRDLGTPVIDVAFSMGIITSLLEARESLYPIGWLKIPEVKDCDAIIRARGDSMSPRINDRDWIGIKRMDDWKNILPPGYIYAIVTNELEIVKYIMKGSSPNKLTLASHNKHYEDFELDKSQILEVWMVKSILPFSKVETLI